VLPVVVVCALSVTGTFASHAWAALLTPGTPPTGAVQTRPSSGLAGSSFDIVLPLGAACPTLTVDTRWHTFVVPYQADPSQLNFTGGVPTIAGSNANIAPLLSFGIPVVDQYPTVPDGVIQVGRYFQFSSYAPGRLAPGAYKVGVACTDASGDTTAFWQTGLQLSTDPSGAITAFDRYSPPSAPELSLADTGTSQTFAGKVRVDRATPAITSIVVTATSTDGGIGGSQTITTLQYGPTRFSIAGLTDGKTYNVTAIATNVAGDSAVSNVLSGVVFDINAFKVSNLTATVSATGYDLSWGAPTGALALSYTVDVAPAITGSPFSTTATTIPIDGLDPTVTYSLTVTPVFDPPFAGSPVSLVITQGPAQIVAVTRPPGILEFTQICGLYGALPADPASPGFPDLPAVPATGIGTAPTIDAAGLIPDPAFPQYPNPVDAQGNPAPTYPTHCGLDFGIATLVTGGPEAGKYFAASGRLNEITVLDTRDTDSGWVLSGAMSDFVSASDTFSGNYLGWTPALTSDSLPTIDGYDQVAKAGPPTLPDAVNGMASASRPLGEAAPGEGLGLAVFDARLKLFVPLVARTGLYTATLTLSVI
jgi:hypothetical protein